MTATRHLGSRRHSAILALCLALAGCAGTPDSTFYTLTALPAAGGQRPLASAGLGLGLGPLTFPAFLDRPQIVSRDSGNRLSVDEYNRWGGTLQDDFSRVLSENLSYLLGTSRVVIFPSEVRYPLDFRIAVDVLAFEGTPAGEAVLKVRWAVLDPQLEQALATEEGTYRQPIVPGPVSEAKAPPDRRALIAALSAALAELSQDIAVGVQGLPKPVQPPKASPLY